MPSDAEGEVAQLAQIDADLAELTTHVNTWLQDRFLTSDDVASLNLEDLAGLVAWLQQWHAHFDTYLDGAGPAVEARLAQIRTEIDASIANFTEMAATLPDRRPDQLPEDLREGLPTDQED
jgi:hypothetical protein